MGAHSTSHGFGMDFDYNGDRKRKGRICEHECLVYTKSSFCNAGACFTRSNPIKNMFLQTIFFCVNIIIRFLDLWEIPKAKLDETSREIRNSPSPCSPRGIVPEKYFPMPKCETIPIDEPGSSFCGPPGFANRLQ